jgi:hypothetical protein
MPARRSNAEQRRAEIARIHVLAKQAGLDPKDPDPDSAYRSMLRQHGGADSSAALTAAGRRAVVEHLRGTGRPPAPRGNPRSRLIRHLWHCLHQAGAVEARDGCNAWVQHWTAGDVPGGYQRPELLPAAVASRLIESLKEWATREGVEWKNPA